MPNYTVYCTWEMGVFLEVEADSLKEAIQKVQSDEGLPTLKRWSRRLHNPTEPLGGNAGGLKVGQEGAEYRDNTFEIDGGITAECNDADPEDVYRYLDGEEG